MDEENSITLIPLQGMEAVAGRIQEYLKEIAPEVDCLIAEVKLPRFATGDAKAVLQRSVRGKDVYILVDVGHYDCKYQMFDRETYMSPDDHFQDLVRTISAVGGKAHRVNVISPLLYSARQDRKISRESLDCAVALQHLAGIGVANLMAFDVHDDRVQNATPFMGFDKLMPTYQIIKAMCRYYPDLLFDDRHMAVVSPDFGGISRNHIFSNELGLDLGVFYKRRSNTHFVNGSYAMEVHKYIGPEVEDKDVLIVDDIIASGGTMLDAAAKIKEFGAKRVFVAATFGFFTNGTEQFNRAYEAGIIDAVFLTNATYRREEILKAPWYREVNILKYIAYYIFCVHVGKSISTIVDPHSRISALLARRQQKGAPFPQTRL